MFTASDDFERIACSSTTDQLRTLFPAAVRLIVPACQLHPQLTPAVLLANHEAVVTRQVCFIRNHYAETIRSAAERWRHAMIASDKEEAEIDECAVVGFCGGLGVAF